jgi:tetratricopeptide (TPR) repeat protein
MRPTTITLLIVHALSLPLAISALGETDGYGNCNGFNKIAESKEAIDAYTGATKMNWKPDEIPPESAEFYYERGREFLAEKEYRAALIRFDKAIELDPGFAEAYYERGRTHLALNEYQEALRDFDTAIGLDPQFAEPHNARGYICLAQKEYREALKEFNAAIDLKPESERTLSVAYFSRGFAYSGLGRHQEAINDYTRAIGIRPDYASFYTKRGTAYQETNNHLQALKDFDMAIRLDPEYYPGLDKERQRLKEKLDRHSAVDLKQVVSSIEMNDIEGLRVLMESGGNANARFVHRTGVEGGSDVAHTPLTYAASGGRDEIVLLLIEKGAYVNDSVSCNREPLYWAAWLGDESTIRILLQMGANVNIKDCFGDTPLIAAVRGGGDAGKIYLLIEGGADINVKNDDGETPLSIAAGMNNSMAVEALKQAGARK